MQRALISSTALWFLGVLASAVCLPVATAEDEWEKPVPVGFVFDYALWSDYVCRKSMNLSEYPGEGREGLNQQVWTALTVASKDVFDVDFGSFSFAFWADCYADQEHITPNHGAALNEWDLIPSWTYALPRTPLTLAVTYDYWVLPPYDENATPHDNYSGHELWFSLALDDSAIFGCPVLSPYVLWVRDIDDYQANWIDIGFSHTFALASLGCAETPVLRHMSVTPKVVIGIDDGYVDAVVGNAKSTHLASVTYSLTVAYDLAAALSMPKAYGGLSVRGFVHFRDQLHDYDTAGFYPVLRDEVYGGLGIAYSW